MDEGDGFEDDRDAYTMENAFRDGEDFIMRKIFIFSPYRGDIGKMIFCPKVPKG